MLSQKAGKVVWHSYLFKNILRFAVIHTVKGFSVANEAEIDIFLEFPCFFHDPMDVGNLISGSSAFSKSSLNIWKFTVHLLLKAGLKDFEHYLARMCNDCSCAAVPAWDLLKVAIIFITSTMVCPQVKQQGGNTAPPVNRKLD